MCERLRVSRGLRASPLLSPGPGPRAPGQSCTEGLLYPQRPQGEHLYCSPHFCARFSACSHVPANGKQGKLHTWTLEKITFQLQLTYAVMSVSGAQRSGYTCITRRDHPGNIDSRCATMDSVPHEVLSPPGNVFIPGNLLIPSPWHPLHPPAPLPHPSGDHRFVLCV